jgi:hypothetical protein
MTNAARLREWQRQSYEKAPVSYISEARRRDPAVRRTPKFHPGIGTSVMMVS